MSAYSKTTVGGADFDQLCEGAIQNYSFNPADIAGEKKVKRIKRKLVRQLESTVRELELQSDRTIDKIYIGKTFIQRRRNPGGGFKAVDPINHHTWKKNGISSRWQVHRHEDYGRDGMVVLAAITKETMPERCRDRVHQEHFALAMEQKLLHHYLLSHPDPRVVNESFSTGQTTKHRCSAYAVYMAFRYQDKDTATDLNRKLPHKDGAQNEPNDLPLNVSSQSAEDASPSALDQPGPSHTPPSSPLSAFPSFRQTEPVPPTVEYNEHHEEEANPLTQSQQATVEQNTELQPHSSNALHHFPTVGPPPGSPSRRQRKTLSLRRRRQQTTSSPQCPCTSTVVQRLPFTEQTAEAGAVSTDFIPSTNNTSPQAFSERQEEANDARLLNTAQHQQNSLTAGHTSQREEQGRRRADICHLSQTSQNHMLIQNVDLPITNQVGTSPEPSNVSPDMLQSQTQTCIIIDSDSSSSSISSLCSLVSVPKKFKHQDSPLHSSPILHSDSLNRQEIVQRYLAGLPEHVEQNTAPLNLIKL